MRSGPVMEKCCGRKRSVAPSAEASSPTATEGSNVSQLR